MTHLFLCKFTVYSCDFFFSRISNAKILLRKGREVKGKVQIHFSVRVEG